MTGPNGDDSFLRELELTVREEVTEAESRPLESEAGGRPVVGWLLDPDAERYEASLHTLLGAVESLEDGLQ